MFQNASSVDVGYTTKFLDPFYIPEVRRMFDSGAPEALE